MDLEAPHDEVLAQKDQANTAFLLHGYGLGPTGLSRNHAVETQCLLGYGLGPTGRHSSAQPSGLGNCAPKFSGLSGRYNGCNHLIINIIHDFTAVKS